MKAARSTSPRTSKAEAEPPLARYRAKRDFAATPEPSGARARRRRGAKAPLAFYVQRHAARRLHYDFRLELGGVLRSWAVPKGPSLDPAERRLAVETEDHPLDYGGFEGVIPEKQYGAGEVRLWDRGTWSADEPDPAAALARGRLRFHLEGEKLHGGWILARMGGKGEDGAPNWLLIKAHDEAAREGEAAEITRLAPESVAAPAEAVIEPDGRPQRAPAPDSPLPAFVTPQLATLVREPPAGGDWVWEIKYDGYRLLARVEHGEARLFTRGGLDWTRRLPALARGIAELGLDGSWLDGEIVVPDERGLPDFQALQNAFETGGAARVVYYVFDAPWLAGVDLGGQPLTERKQALAERLGGGGAGLVRLSEHFAGGVEGALDQACRLGLEGLIGKRADAPYAAGRSRYWVKLKCRPRQEFVIAGYTEPGGSRKGFGALLLGLYDGAGELHYAGRVGTGFDQTTLERLAARLAKLERKEPPLVDAPAALRRERAHWVRPQLVAEVEFAGWTGDRVLRQASFVGLREDKPAASVQEEKPAAAAVVAPPGQSQGSGREPGPKDTVKIGGVAISHAGRVIWPASGKMPSLTKADLARYYEAVGAWLFPHLRSRPLSLLRCPEGSAAECFFQRHMEQQRPEGLESFVWERSSGKRHHYLYLDRPETIVAMVQRGVIEFHTWGSTLPHPERPDRITIDLDPAPDVDWARVVEGARLARALLDELGLASFLKTTGGKGLHLVVPLERRRRWDEIKAFAHAVAQHLARVVPERFVANMAKSQREGRIFVDYLRNDAGASAVAAFSARARPGATVSTPLAWDELAAALRPAQFTIATVPRRLATLGADPWADYATTRQSLTKSMRERLGLA